MVKSENILFGELQRYYDQLDALRLSDEWYQNKEGKQNTETFYLENIESIRTKCNEVNPQRLKELDTRRANDCPVNEAEEIS